MKIFEEAEQCNSLKKEAEIFGIKQTFFVVLLALIGLAIMLNLVLSSLGIGLGAYILGITIPSVIIVYFVLRAKGDKITIGSMFKLMSYSRVPKYIKSSSYHFEKTKQS